MEEAGRRTDRPIRAAVLTVSDRGYLALRPDLTGPTISAWIGEQGWILVGSEIVSDDPEQVRAALVHWSDRADLVLTTGGTGLSPRDRVPEATLAVADRVVPGIPEWIRGETARAKPHAALSRGVAVLRGGTLIINLPGSPRAVGEYLGLLSRIVTHAVEQARQPPAWGGEDRHPAA